VITIPEDFFKNREEVKTEIRKCALFGGIIVSIGLLFAIIGVIGDAFNRTLILESMSWLLLAVFFGIAALGPLMHSVAAKHLYGIESENKNK
jgi:hypothetical protein